MLAAVFAFAPGSSLCVPPALSAAAARSSSSPAGWPDKRAGEERDEKEGDGTEPAKQQEEQNLCVYSAALHDQRERESERGVGKQSKKKVIKLFFSSDLAGLLLLCKIASFIG